MNTVKVRNLELGNGIPAICIPNVGKTKEDILSLTRTYLDMHMDLMEWRMDWYEDVEDIAKVTELVKELRNVMGDTPLLCTFRTDKEGDASSDCRYYPRYQQLPPLPHTNYRALRLQVYIGYICRSYSV